MRMSARAASAVVLVAAVAADAAGDPPKVKRILRVDVGGAYLEAKGEDPDVEGFEEPELHYGGPVGSFTITGGQLLAPFLAVHGMAFAELGLPECVQWDRYSTCIGESWPLSSGIGGGVTFQSPGGGLYIAFGPWGGVLLLEDPVDEDPRVAPWYGLDVAVGAGWRADRHWHIGLGLRARSGFSSEDDDFRSFTSVSIAMSFARR